MIKVNRDTKIGDLVDLLGMTAYHICMNAPEGAEVEAIEVKITQGKIRVAWGSEFVAGLRDDDYHRDKNRFFGSQYSINGCLFTSPKEAIQHFNDQKEAEKIKS